VGYLRQELELPPRPELRLLPAFAAGLGGNIDQHAEALLGLGLFRAREFHVPVGSLSAGQQRRLALARLLLGGYGTLIMDEPTNHLAPVLVEQLEGALADFPGTLVMVSHDRALREWFARCQWSSRGAAGGPAGTPAGNTAVGRWTRYSMDKGVLAPV
jgi:macrolide transport system ATP-binding/permease protein